MARRSSISDPVKPALLAALRAQLAQGECLAWAASPEPAAVEPEARGIGKLEGLAIVGGGYVTLAAGVMAALTDQWLWLSIPIAIAACGLAVYCAARWNAARARKSLEGTIYGVTTRRAMLLHTYPALAVRVLPIEAITDVSTSDEHDDSADLCLHAASASASLMFQRISEAERARAQIMQVIRDPQGAEQQIAAAELYALQMRQLMARH